MTDDISVSVSTPEAAVLLREDFEELVARVNGELMSYSMKPDDPISVEAAVVYAEQRIDYHLNTFLDSAALQSIAPDIKLRFRQAIEKQASESF